MSLEITKVQPQGFCGGVMRAITLAKKARQEYPKQRITILGQLVHNQYVTKELEDLNIQTVEGKLDRLSLLDQVDEGMVIFTAHGVSQAVKEKAEQKGLMILDASCHFVIQTQHIVQEKLKEGYHVFYIGKLGHPEAESIYTTSQHISLIQKTKDIPLNITKPIFVTNQTTMSSLDVQHLFSAIQKQYPQAQFQNELCSATRVRQQAILDLDVQDALIIVGDPASNNTQKLAEIGRSKQIPIVLLTPDVQHLDWQQVPHSGRIAVSSGASTPGWLVDELIEKLKEWSTSHR